MSDEKRYEIFTKYRTLNSAGSLTYRYFLCLEEVLGDFPLTSRIFSLSDKMRIWQCATGTFKSFSTKANADVFCEKFPNLT